MHLLARQPIDPDRPHPFTAAGNTEFNCLLWMPPNQQRAGDMVLVDSTNFTTLFGGTDSLASFWRDRTDEISAAGSWPTALTAYASPYGRDSHADGPVEQSGHCDNAWFCGFKHAGNGFGLTIRQIIEPLRNARLVLLALLANFVLMPLGALALAKVLWLDNPFAVGLLVLGCAAGALFLPKLAELAKGNLAFSVGAMVLLMVVTVGYLPVVMPLMLPGSLLIRGVIARSLVLLMLLPLATGLALKARYEELASRVKPC